MFLFFGTRRAGVIERSGPTHIETHVFHVWGIPLVPLGSYLVLGPGEHGMRAIPLGLHAGSVLAAYARGWGVITALFGLFLAWRHASDAFSVIALGLGVTAVAFAIGHLGPAARARRAVYARHALHPVDPAVLADARGPMAEELRAEITARARTTLVAGYRDSAALPDDIPTLDLLTHVANNSTLADPQLLGAAMTLARIESSLARGPAFAEIHDRLWLRLRTTTATTPATSPA